MNKVNPKKLKNSKWTAAKPINKEKHFVVVDVEFDEDFTVVLCVIEAVMTKRQISISWRELNDANRWLTGWQ